jgi:uncharacterized membrane protein
MKAKLRKYFLGGLLVVVPISLTIYILVQIIQLTDRLFPTAYLPFYFPGFGILITFCIIMLIGIITTNLLGKRLVSLGEKIIVQIPLVKAIYNPIKQIFEAIFSMEEQNFRRVVLIEYPRRGIYTMAFVTGIAKGEIQDKTKNTVVNVFVPTTPNPTSGFYLMVPEGEVTELDLTVDEAFRLIVSGGMASK